MGKLAILLACLIWGVWGWKVHHWAAAQTHQRTRWVNQLTTLQESRTALSTGGTAAYETLRNLPPDCVPQLLLGLLIRRGTPLDGTLAAAEETLPHSMPTPNGATPSRGYAPLSSSWWPFPFSGFCWAWCWAPTPCASLPMAAAALLCLPE